MIPGIVRDIIEKTYEDTCTVTEKVKTKVNGVVSFLDKEVLVDEPCRLSYSSSPSAKDADGVASISQSIKLFISPDVDVKPGAKIVVTHNGENVAYKRGGVSAMYETHQEIELELYEERA